MATRTYDVVLTVDSATGFETGNFVVGVSSETVGVLAAVDSSNNLLKVKLSNVNQEYFASEVIQSNTVSLSSSGSLTPKTNTYPFEGKYKLTDITTASANVSGVSFNPYIAEKNAFTQNPIVRLYSIYYPGEWYPPNNNGNPTENGEGRAWPNQFPFKFAEIVGDLSADINYNVSLGGTEFTPIPITITNMDESSDGKINDLTLSMYNLDNIVTGLVEDPYLLGNNISNSVVALVNGDFVHGIDPRTVNADPADVGVAGEEAYDTLYRARQNNLLYSASVVNLYGTANASFTKSQTEGVNGEWSADKEDSRDLLGGVVEVKTTFANFLDFWPEYSLSTGVTANVVSVSSALPYRVGDNVVSSKGNTEATILEIGGNETLYLSSNLHTGTTSGDAIYIVNVDADPDSYIKDTFKIDQLEGLSDYVASFGLISWLQYFKLVTPRRKYYKNTCQWKYKGEECQYPGHGGLSIPGTTRISNTNPIAANNEVASSATGDVCAKSLLACTLRNNQHHFGGFPGTGRSIPK